MRLDDAFRLLTGGSRTSLPRHQTLRATIDWSYNLLSDAERSLLARLAVLAGGGMLEAVEAICSGDGLEKQHVFDLLVQLVDKSLVTAERKQGEEPRYELLETIRQYGREKLSDSGRSEAVRERHARWYAELAEIAEAKIQGHGQVAWFDRMEQEHDNVRAALDWSLHNNLEPGMRIASALTWFWQLRGHAVEGYRHMEELLAAAPVEPSPLHAKMLSRAGWLAVYTGHEQRGISLSNAAITMSREVGSQEDLAVSHVALAVVPYWHGELDRALPLAEEGLALAEKAGIKWGIRHALGPVGYITQAQGEYEKARSIYHRSLELSREIGDINGASWSLYLLGSLALEQGFFVQAMAFYQESQPLARQTKSKPLISWITRQMANAAIELGHHSQARSLLEESIIQNRELGDNRRLAFSLNRLGRVARLQGEYEEAMHFYSESLRMAWKYEARQTAAWSMAGLAELVALQNEPNRAARLMAAAQAQPDLYISLGRHERLEIEQMADTIRSRLDEATFFVEQEAGRKMAFEEAIAHALEETSE